MKKTMLTILLIFTSLFVITGCGEGERKNDEHSFYGKVLEVYSSYIIVEPNEDEEERKSSDKFHIDLKNDDITYEVGTNVKITYIGGINESYPAQVGTTKIEIVENKNSKKHYSKVINNIKIDLDIPKEWKYAEMSKDEDDTYSLKIYKSNENQYAILSFYNNEFVVCGTGRTSTTIILNNGEEAIIGYYDGNKDWWDISFDSNRHLAFINHGLENSEAEEFLEFVKTINIEQN